MQWKTTRISTINFLVCILIVLILSTSSICVFPLNGEELNEVNVKVAVETWVRYMTADPKPGAVVEKMEPYIDHNITIAYIAHLKDGGFCICGSNKLLLPVYLYNPLGKYNPSNPGYQYILQEIEGILEYLQGILKNNDSEILEYQEIISQRDILWENLINGRIPQSIMDMNSGSPPNMMELPLTTHWDQSPDPYNSFCPMGDGGRTIAGCVAIAMSQIMKYWNWPSSGKGNPSYAWDGDQSCNGNVGGGTLSVSCSDSYDWSNMANEYHRVILPDGSHGWADENGDILSQANLDALSELCYEAGVSVNMDYGACSSGAYDNDVPPALEDYFCYDTDADIGGISIDTITNEIQYLRPVYMRGTWPNVGGHAFVIYGYNTGTDPNREFLMNMGWDGNDFHVWYTIDNVPFNTDRLIITKIAPPKVKFYYNSRLMGGGDGSPSSPFQSTLSTAIRGTPDYGTLIFKAGTTFKTGSFWTYKITKKITLKGYNVIIQKGLLMF